MHYLFFDCWIVWPEIDTLTRQTRQRERPERRCSPVKSFHHLVDLLTAMGEVVWKNVLFHDFNFRYLKCLVICVSYYDFYLIRGCEIATTVSLSEPLCYFWGFELTGRYLRGNLIVLRLNLFFQNSAKRNFPPLLTVFQASQYCFKTLYLAAEKKGW